MRRTKIVLVSGKAQSGKDTFCDFAIEQLTKQNLVCKKYAFADFLKYIAEVMFEMNKNDLYGSNEDKNKLTNIKVVDLPHPTWISVNRRENLTIREFLQYFGTEVCRKINDNCWVNSCLYAINKDNPDIAFICDARFPSEVNCFLNQEKMSKYSNIDPTPIVVRLTRNILDNQHASETALDDFDWSQCNTILTVNDTMTLDQKNIYTFNMIMEQLS